MQDMAAVALLTGLLLAGIPIAWPCPERACIWDLLPDAANRLLPDSPAVIPPDGDGQGQVLPGG